MSHFFTKVWGQVIVVLLVLIGFGTWRMEFEAELTEDLRDAELLSPSLDLAQRGMLDQKGFAAAFGSVRPVWAAMKSLGATKYHTEGDWDSLEKAYREIVVLDPKNVNYWDVGSWHLAYNASSASLEDESLPPLERKILFKKYIEKGSEFLDQGIVANPEEWRLPVLKAKLWSSEFRIKDYDLVVRTLRSALEIEDIPPVERAAMKRMIFYSLLRMPERRQEAYEVGYNLWKEGQRQKYPSVMNGLFVLQLDSTLKFRELIGFKEIYGDMGAAYKHLRNYWRNQGRGMPIKGLDRVLKDMEKRLGVRNDARLFPVSQ